VLTHARKFIDLHGHPTHVSLTVVLDTLSS
jgi:hypothetical protein